MHHSDVKVKRAAFVSSGSLIQITPQGSSSNSILMNIYGPLATDRPSPMRFLMGWRFDRFSHIRVGYQLGPGGWRVYPSHNWAVSLTFGWRQRSLPASGLSLAFWLSLDLPLSGNGGRKRGGQSFQSLCERRLWIGYYTLFVQLNKPIDYTSRCS